jgi:hypothetical protein
MAVALSERTLRHEELDSGTTYGYVMPDVARMKLSGFFGKSVVALLNVYLSDPMEFIKREFSDDQWEAWNEAQCRLVSWMVRTVDGEAVSLDPDDLADPEQFPSDDREGLFLRGMRIQRLVIGGRAPKAVSPETWAIDYLEAKGFTVTARGT